MMGSCPHSSQSRGLETRQRGLQSRPLALGRTLDGFPQPHTKLGPRGGVR